MISKIITCVKNPKMALSYLMHRNLTWSEGEGIRMKKYGSYDEYISHQREKLELMGRDMVSKMNDFEDELTSRLKSDTVDLSGKSVLCLGARLGHEVRAFNRLRCFAIGIDLNPGKGNKNVVTGDFHDLPWGESCVDVVYTNSLDHSFSLDGVISEIRRVLKPGGLMILEINSGSKDGGKYKYYESMAWDRSQDVIGIFEQMGFKTESMRGFSMHETHVIMRLKK